MAERRVYVEKDGRPILLPSGDSIEDYSKLHFNIAMYARGEVKTYNVTSWTLVHGAIIDFSKLPSDLKCKLHIYCACAGNGTKTCEARLYNGTDTSQIGSTLSVPDITPQWRSIGPVALSLSGEKSIELHVQKVTTDFELYMANLSIYTD